jgi:hypothetical protein
LTSVRAGIPSLLTPIERLAARIEQLAEAMNAPGTRSELPASVELSFDAAPVGGWRPPRFPADTTFNVTLVFV